MIKGLIEQATVLKWQHLIAKSIHPNLIEAHFFPPRRQFSKSDQIFHLIFKFSES